MNGGKRANGRAPVRAPPSKEDTTRCANVARVGGPKADTEEKGEVEYEDEGTFMSVVEVLGDLSLRPFES